MKTLLLAVVFAMLAWVPSTQIEKKYPAMTGTNLVGESVSLPSTGKVSLVALAYSPKSEEYLKTWRKPLFDLFIKAPSTSLFQFDPYDANINFVVLLTGAKKVAGKKVKTKLEESVAEHWKEHIVVVKGKTLNHYQVLDLGKSKEEKVLPYFFLMDASGNIVYSTSGAYSKKKFHELDDKLRELLGSNQVD